MGTIFSTRARVVTRPTRRRRGGGRRGFTLIEAALVTCLIGFGVVSILQLLAAGTMSNVEAMELTTGLTLANNVREMMQSLSFTDPVQATHWGPETGETLATYNDVDDFDGATFSPPLDARRQSLSGFSAWTQHVDVYTCDPNRLQLSVPKGTKPMNKVVVTVSHNGRVVAQTSWLIVSAQ